MTTDLNTAFRHRLFYLRRSRYQHVCSLVNKFRTAKNIRETLSAFTQMQAGHGIGAGVVKCTKVRTSWLSSVLGLAGGREAWKAWISRIFFVCLTCSALDRWGKKTDISVPCPMSRSAKQDLPSVRLLSVVFLSANEFWKSENSREKVHTRCALGFMSVLYTLFMKIASLRLTSNSQEIVDH